MVEPPGSVIDVIVTEVHLPPGMAGPDALSFDVRCFAVPARGGIVLVDAGTPGTANEIEASIGRLGGTRQDITDVVLTHRHFDHVGGLAQVADRAPRARLWAGRADVPEIAAACRRDVSAVEEGDRVGDLTVIESPGHTPGHISLFLSDHAVLLIGDVIGAMGGQVDFGPAAFTADAAGNRVSLAKMLDLGADRIVFSHGSEIPEPNQRIRELLASS